MSVGLDWMGWLALVFIFAFWIFDLVSGSGMGNGGKENGGRSIYSHEALSLANDEANGVAIS